MLNNCVLEGRLTRDPELKRTASGLCICNINIAVDRTIKKKEGKPALFIPVTFYGAVAENASKWLSKGRAVTVIGRLENDEYKDKATGEKKTIYFINASTFELPSREKKAEQPAAKDTTPAVEDNGIDIVDDDDLPF